MADPDGTLMAFFPGLPVIFWLFEQLGVPVAITGVVLSLACSAFAAAALYRLGGPWAAVAWLFAPTAVFTVVPYTESLFLRRCLLGLGTRPLRSLAGRRRAHGSRLHATGIGAVPDRRTAGDDHH